MKFLMSVITACIFLPILFLILFTPAKCEHEEVTRYVFSSDDSMAHSSACGYCTKCDTRLTSYFLFQGELVDKSYLSALVEHSDASEIVPGEYYTVTASVPLGFYGTSNAVWLTCEVENDDFIVRFSAEFQEEFKDQIRSIQEGDTITFRGRFYDEGCRFTDCELIK